MLPIRDLKRRYKIALALGESAPTADRAIPLPLSTGNPLYDAALTDKLVATATMDEAEHLSHGWHAVRHARDEERATLARHAPKLLNDYKLLLALSAWERGDEAQTNQFLRALPWGWRLAFPTALIKPAATLFTGWRRTLDFRLVDDPRYPALYEQFRRLLAAAPPVALLKYRATVKESAALLHYRFEGERERAIHDLAFGKGRAAVGLDTLEPIGTAIRARDALASRGTAPFLQVLETSEYEIPITSFMGLLGSAGLSLTGDATAERERLRAYALRSATAVEILLRLAEWGPWLSEAQSIQLGERLRREIVEQGRDIPLFKAIKGFMAAPRPVRQALIEPLMIPLFHHFGQQMTPLFGTDRPPLLFVQPANVLHLMSFLLYSLLSSAMPTRMLLFDREGATEMEPLPLAEVARHLADEQGDMEEWLLSRFGGMAMQHYYQYDFDAVAQRLRATDPSTPLLLDMPFAYHDSLLAALLPFDMILNLNYPFGAPGELSLAYTYYSQYLFQMPRWTMGSWRRYSDQNAMRFAEFADRLLAFQALAAEADSTEGRPA